MSYSHPALLTLAMLMMPTLPVLADERPPPAQHRFFYQTTVAARVAPLGLLGQVQLGYRFRLYEGAGPVLRDNYVGVSVLPTLSPGFARIGGLLELQPFAPLRLSAMIDNSAYLRTFNLLQSFPTVTAPHSDTVLRAGSAAGDNYNASVVQVTLGALLQGRLDKFILRNNFRAVYSNGDLRAGDRGFYDLAYDVMAPDDGWIVVNDVDAVYELEPGFVVGARHHLTKALYGAQHFAPGEPTNDINTPFQRLGPFVSYRFGEDDGSLLHSATLLASAQWYLQHRFRTGQDTSAALPLILVVFQFSGDFITIP